MGKAAKLTLAPAETGGASGVSQILNKNRKKLSTGEKVVKAVSSLGHGSSVIVAELFGLVTGVRKTPERVSAELGTTPDQVREIEEEALRSLMGYGRGRDKQKNAATIASEEAGQYLAARVSRN